MSNIIIYIRVSTQEQHAENQLEACNSINDYGDAEILKDKQSAFKDYKERPAFEKLKEKIKSGEVEHLVVFDFDRIYRNRKKFKQFLELLKGYDVKLHSYNQQWMENLNQIPSPWNDIVMDLMINIFGYLAEEESRKKG